VWTRRRCVLLIEDRGCFVSSLGVLQLFVLLSSYSYTSCRNTALYIHVCGCLIYAWCVSATTLCNGSKSRRVLDINIRVPH